MKVAFHSNMYDPYTERIAKLLHAPLKQLGNAMSGDYGGPMEHLWVDIELIPARADVRAPYAFRLQKRVSGKSRLIGLDSPDKFNVGHYSVRPDFHHLLSLPDGKVLPYILQLIESSLANLETTRRLSGFDVSGFKKAFASASALLAKEENRADGA